MGRDLADRVMLGRGVNVGMIVQSHPLVKGRRDEISQFKVGLGRQWKRCVRVAILSSPGYDRDGRWCIADIVILRRDWFASRKEFDDPIVPCAKRGLS